MRSLSVHKLFRLRLVILTALLAALWSSVPVRAQQAEAPVFTELPEIVRTIQVIGNQRVEANTVASYLLFAPGDPFSEQRVDLSIKTLYRTGLFADVAIEPRDGNILIRVVENPIINRVILEGNKALKSDKITDEIEAEPRALFTRAAVQSDVQRIIELYRQSGRFAATVTPKIVQQPKSTSLVIMNFQTAYCVKKSSQLNRLGINFSHRMIITILAG